MLWDVLFFTLLLYMLDHCDGGCLVQGDCPMVVFFIKFCIMIPREMHSKSTLIDSNVPRGLSYGSVSYILEAYFLTALYNLYGFGDGKESRPFSIIKGLRPCRRDT